MTCWLFSMKVEITENILVKTSGHILSRKLIKSLINAIKHKKNTYRNSISIMLQIWVSQKKFCKLRNEVCGAQKIRVQNKFHFFCSAYKAWHTFDFLRLYLEYTYIHVTITVYNFWPSFIWLIVGCEIWAEIKFKTWNFEYSHCVP